MTTAAPSFMVRSTQLVCHTATAHMTTVAIIAVITAEWLCTTGFIIAVTDTIQNEAITKTSMKRVFLMVVFTTNFTTTAYRILMIDDTECQKKLAGNHRREGNCE
jgi:hypothetical protein